MQGFVSRTSLFVVAQFRCSVKGNSKRFSTAMFRFLVTERAYCSENGFTVLLYRSLHLLFTQAIEMGGRLLWLSLRSRK